MKENKDIKVLIIEDEQEELLMYKTQFLSNGFSVVEAKNANEGLEKAKEFIPDIILLDLVLQDQMKTSFDERIEISGIKLLEKLKVNSDTKHIPVIILTNLGREEHEANTLKLGAVAYLVKSELLPSEIVEIVKKYIETGDIPKN